MKECLGYFLIYVAIAGGAIFLLGYDLSWRERFYPGNAGDVFLVNLDCVHAWNFSGTYSIRRINRHRCVSYIGGRCINGVHI